MGDGVMGLLLDRTDDDEGETPKVELGAAGAPAEGVKTGWPAATGRAEEANEDPVGRFMGGAEANENESERWWWWLAWAAGASPEWGMAMASGAWEDEDDML